MSDAAKPPAPGDAGALAGPTPCPAPASPTAGLKPCPTDATPTDAFLSAGLTPCPTHDAVVCERCGGANVYRMHAVWRCADCGYKTDCCGW